MTSPRRRPGNPMEYSSLGIQMAAMIGLCVFIGFKLDKKVQTEKPWFTIGFAIFGIAAAMFYVLRRLL